MTLLDLIQECNITLIDSIDKFDPQKNTKFSTYVVKAMKRNLQRDIDNKDRIIRKPINVEVINFNYKRYMQDYYEKNKCYPSDDEIKRALNLTDYQLNQQKTLDYLIPESLNKKIQNDDGEGNEIEDFIVNENNQYNSYNNFIDSKILLLAARTLLTKKEYYIIYDRYINNKTLEEIGREFKFSRERTRQVEKKALNKMSLLIKKYQSRVLEKYSIEELENMNLKPLSPSEIAVYYHLKKGLDKVSYYFLYNIRQNDYDIDVLCNKFSFISEKEIRPKI